eukprot:2279420-Rhodomonas_salina.1
MRSPQPSSRPWLSRRRSRPRRLARRPQEAGPRLALLPPRVRRQDAPVGAVARALVQNHDFRDGQRRDVDVHVVPAAAPVVGCVLHRRNVRRGGRRRHRCCHAPRHRGPGRRSPPEEVVRRREGPDKVEIDALAKADELVLPRVDDGAVEVDELGLVRPGRALVGQRQLHAVVSPAAHRQPLPLGEGLHVEHAGSTVEPLGNLRPDPDPPARGLLHAPEVLADGPAAAGAVRPDPSAARADVGVDLEVYRARRRELSVAAHRVDVRVPPVRRLAAVLRLEHDRHPLVDVRGEVDDVAAPRRAQPISAI